MPNISLFFIGVAILSIFGGRGLILFIIGYFIYKNFIEKNKDILQDLFDNERKNLKGKNIIQNLFKSKFFEDAQFYDPKKSKQKNISSFNFFSMKNFPLKTAIFLFSGIIIFLIILDGLVMVPAGYVAVILDRGRGVLEEPLPTGLHLKIPFWQNTTLIDIRLQTYTMSGIPSEGEIAGNDAIEALTKDGQKVKIDATVQFFLTPENSASVYEKVGLDYIAKIVRPAARSVIRNVITGFTSKELFQIETRQKTQQMMISGMKENLEIKKIKLDDVLLRNIQFSEIYLNAIEEKQVAEQKIQKAKFERDEAEIKKEKKIIEATAEAESIRLKGDALQKNPAVVQFEMIQKLAPNIKWGVLPDGVLPMLDLKNLEE